MGKGQKKSRKAGPEKINLAASILSLAAVVIELIVLIWKILAGR